MFTRNVGNLTVDTA